MQILNCLEGDCHSKETKLGSKLLHLITSSHTSKKRKLDGNNWWVPQKKGTLAIRKNKQAEGVRRKIQYKREEKPKTGTEKIEDLMVQGETKKQKTRVIKDTRRTMVTREKTSKSVDAK